MPDLPAPGSLIGGKYRIVRLIGEGGMGAVFEARHEHLGSRVALKFLHPDLAQRPGLVARFLQEARVSASIRSPYVTQVIDVDQTPDGAAYLVMELLEGESLEQRIARGPPLALAQVLELAMQVLSALEAAHAQGVVHRDLKPDNVWLSPSPSGPHVKLLDFGIAKLKVSTEYRSVTTRPGSMMGTPAYMAPEQAISADQVDQRADIYSFGVILYELLSGSRPVDTDDPAQILERLVRGEVHPLAERNPNLPLGLAPLVDRLVAPDPDARPSTAAAVRAELSRFVRATEYGVRPSLVPPTVPPDDRGVPPFVTSAQAVAAGRGTTDSMPKMPELALAPTAVATAPPMRASLRPKRRGWAVLLWATLVAALAGAGVWAYMNQSVFDDSALPPMPGPAPTTFAPIQGVDTARPVEKEATPRRPRPATPAPQVAPKPGTPEVPAPYGSTLPMPQIQIPNITLPSSLPFPISLPSNLPSIFQQIPGFGPPAAAASGASPAPSR